MDAAIWGFIGVVIGGVLAFGGQWLEGRRQNSLDASRRADDRQIERERDQRATLIQVQDAANRYVLDVSDYIVMSPGSPERGNAGRALIVSSIQLKTLSSRCFDDVTHRLSEELVRSIAALTDSSGVDSMPPVAKAANALIDHVGPLIRATYRDPGSR